MSYTGARLAVFQGGAQLGEVDVYSVPGFTFPSNEIEIYDLSPPGDGVPPLAVLLTLSPSSMRCKIDAGIISDQSPLAKLHSTLLNSRRTGIIRMKGGEELHLIAVPSREKKPNCFWCWSISTESYNHCLIALQRRILSIVFDLDQTLVAAINSKDLYRQIKRLEDDCDCPRKMEELERVIADFELLQAFIENEEVNDGEKKIKASPEEALTIAPHVKISRPVIRLPEKNMVLTRINPENKDSSMVVRLREGWDALKAFLVVNDRKRFDPYVCTHATLDYALEVWRLLDPDSSLINSKQLHRRICSVASSSKKSLANVFRGGYPTVKMSIIVDDRLDVWVHGDKPSVHVIPPFKPYFSPRKEMTSEGPVLSFFMSIIASIRKNYFRDYDDFHEKIKGIHYEDSMEVLPLAPDIRNAMIIEPFSRKYSEDSLKKEVEDLSTTLNEVRNFYEEKIEKLRNKVVQMSDELELEYADNDVSQNLYNLIRQVEGKVEKLNDVRGKCDKITEEYKVNYFMF